MRGVTLFVKVLGLTSVMAFTPIMVAGVGLSQLSFWPFPIQQTLVLILVGGALFHWYLMRMCYEHSSLAWTYYATELYLRVSG